MHKKYLVIDASIACTSGEKSESGKRCRALLDSVLEICNRLAMTEAVQREWDDHAADYARKWSAAMKSRGKLKLFEVDQLDVLLRRISELKKAGSRQKQEMQKDVLLLEGAKAADCRILSVDEKARGYFRKYAEYLPELNGIIWANPNKQEDDVIRWLKRGAPNDDSLLLRPKKAP